MTKTLTPDLKCFIISFILILLTSNSLFSQKYVDYKPPSEWAWGIEDSTEYFIYTPGNLELGKRYPIALYLHGCCGDSPHAIPHRAADPPVRMWHNFTENTQDIPTYIISPQTTRGWSQHFESLKKVIDFLVEKRQGDPQRIYIVGFSMGGRGLYQFISEYPDYFAAAIPIGMSFFNGDFEKIKDIPIWANQGSEDRWAREMPKFVRETRAMNGLDLDSAYEWITGVNPLYTSFEGQGHLIQWEAASQDLTGWAYSKVNDGNKYPQVYFLSPEYRGKGKARKSYKVKVNAQDPDGTISKVELYVNKQLKSTLTQSPFEEKIIPVSGDNLLEAVAYDDKGKSTTATTILVTDNSPQVGLETLPYGRVGAYYSYWIPARGNGQLRFTAKDLPEGLTLLNDGLLRGIPAGKGDNLVKLIITDEDGDQTTTTLKLVVKEKREGEVLLSNVKDVNGNKLPVSKLVIGETPTFKTGEADTSFIGKESFSDLSEYSGVTFIKSEASDSTKEDEPYMTFEVDQPVEVMIGYETLDNRFTSTVPGWLNEYQKAECKQILAQLRYFDVYKKNFSPGKISLPGGDKKNNGVVTNYFVMVKSAQFNNAPEINLSRLPTGQTNSYYESKLSCLYGDKKLKYKLVSGTIPPGLSLVNNGMVTGSPTKSGIYTFQVSVVDEKRQTDQSEIQLVIK